MILFLGFLNVLAMLVGFVLGCEVGSASTYKQFCDKCKDHCVN